MRFPDKLSRKLAQRSAENALRSLPQPQDRIDFASNDYLGFSRSAAISAKADFLRETMGFAANGATGSRLLTGNHRLYAQTEDFIARFHQAEMALIFNSGYDANVGFFSAVPQKGDYILYDELCHASIRDGLQLSKATSYKFDHNNFDHLAQLLERHHKPDAHFYVVTESVFSMDGDTPNLEQMVSVCKKFDAYPVVDEAHALGVFGPCGAGMVQELQLEQAFFARIVTFGKGLGCHGAAILGSAALRDYLVNFCRSLIYTTGLSPHSVATIFAAYQEFETSRALSALRERIVHFNREKNLLGLKPLFIRSPSAIQSAVLPGNDRVKEIAAQLQAKGFELKPILSPTVPAGQERLRFCLHSFNTEAEITQVLHFLRTFIT